MRQGFGVLIAVLISFSSVAQKENKIGKKGKFYTAWGWNRGYFSKSNLQFIGKDYNFTLQDVVAKDEPSKFNPGIHLNPLKLTIPQTNFRLGYYLNDKYSISFGFDHMKYVMKQNQEVKISGEIDKSGTEYDGTYSNDNITLTKDFLEYENTDGLNLVFFELNRHDRLFSVKKKNGNELLALEIVEGISFGCLYPRTDAHLMKYRRNNEFHVTGYGTGIKLGTRLEFLKHFFVQNELKGGFINMPNVKATESNAEKVKQHFYYYQTNIMIGGVFQLPHKKVVRIPSN